MTFAEQIRYLVQTKQYEVALLYFKNNKLLEDATSIGKNKVLVADMLTALRNTKAFEAAYRFLDIYSCDIDNNTPIRLVMSYGWLLYAHYKHLLIQPESNFRKIEAEIIKVITLLQNTTDSYSDTLVINLFRICMQRQKQLLHMEYEWIWSICSRVNVEKLPSECSVIQIERKGMQRDMELASLQEIWYSMYSKAMFEIKQYEGCLSICNKALQAINNMHYDNAIWFERRRAQCYAALNQYDLSIEIYQKIVREKNDWYLKSELSQLYWATGNKPTAIDWARKAASCSGPINFKVELIEFLGKMLQAEQKPELAAKHFYLSRQIRVSEGWKVSQSLLNNISTCDVDQAFSHQSKESLKTELSNYWGHVTNKNDRLVGVVELLHAPNDKGRSGILKDKNGRKAFFFIPNTLFLYQQLAIGKAFSYSCIETEKGFKAQKMKPI